MSRKFLSWFIVVAVALIWAMSPTQAMCFTESPALATVDNTGAESTPFATTPVVAVAVTAAKIPVASEAAINPIPAGAENAQPRLVAPEVVTVRKALIDVAQDIIWLFSDSESNGQICGGGETNGARPSSCGDDEGFVPTMSPALPCTIRYTALTT